MFGFNKHKRDSNVACIICEKSFNNGWGNSQELCYDCYQDFVVLKKHLRTCEYGTKFMFKRFNNNQPERSKREDHEITNIPEGHDYCTPDICRTIDGSGKEYCSVNLPMCNLCTGRLK